MIKARRAIAGVIAGAAILAALPFAANAASSPVEVSVKNEGGVIRFGSRMGTQPLFGGHFDTNTGKGCVGFSYQVPQCVQVPLDAIDLSVSDPFGGQSPLIVDTDPSDDGRIGVGSQIGRQPLLSVWYYPATGRLCAGFSYQVPFCMDGAD
jgi:hypothetical protein